MNIIHNKDYKLNFKNSLWWPFLCFLLIQLLIAFYSQTYFLTDDLYHLIIGSEINKRQFDEYLEFVRKWQWVSYLIIPISLLLHISFAWICLKTGSFVNEKFIDAPFWKICIYAELVFAIGSVATLLYTEFFSEVRNLEQLSINPFSLQVFMGSSLPPWTINPF